MTLQNSCFPNFELSIPFGLISGAMLVFFVVVPLAPEKILQAYPLPPGKATPSSTEFQKQRSFIRVHNPCMIS